MPLPLRLWPRPARARRSTVRLSPDLLEDRSVPTVTVTGGFVGRNFADNLPVSSGYTPPDTGAAVGTTHVVETINAIVTVYDKATGTMVGYQPLQDVFGTPGARFSDPVVTFDPTANRFVIGALDLTNNTFDVGVTNVETTGGLQLTEIQKLSTKESGYWADYPRLGWNGDAYLVSFNMFTTTNAFNHVQVLGINKASVTDDNAATVTAFRADRTYVSGHFTMTPAVMHDGGAGLMWFLDGASFGNGKGLTLSKLTYKWTSTGATGVTFTDKTVALPAAAYYGAPPAASQLGGSQITTNDARVLSVAARGGRLVAAQAVGEGDGRAHARFYDLDTTKFDTMKSGATTALNQWGDVTPGVAGSATFFPSIEINKNGDLGMTFLESGPAEDLSMYVTGQMAANRVTGAAQGAMQAPAAAAPGQAPYQAYDPVPYRAGDYSTVALDPADDTTFWAANEYATAPTGNNWGTWMASFSVTAGTGTATATAPAVVAVASPTLTVSLVAEADDQPRDDAPDHGMERANPTAVDNLFQAMANRDANQEDGRWTSFALGV